MKTPLSLIVIIMLLVFLFVAGCTNQTPQSNQSIDATTTNATAPTEPPTTIPPSPSQARVSFTNDEVNRHFMIIAFGQTNSKLNKVFPNTHVSINLQGQANTDDAKFISDFAKSYNQFTETEIFDSPVEIEFDDYPYHHRLNINFYPSAYIKEMGGMYEEKDPTTDEYLYAITYPIQGSRITHPIPSQYYINSKLSITERNRYIMKSMLHFLGFSGKTYDYPDSYFYVENKDGINLSPLDQAAIRVMYNPAFSNGMSKEAVEDVLFIGD
jgi:hypothetical protein